jgi:hypothetical protein
MSGRLLVPLVSTLMATALLAGCGNKGDLVRPPPPPAPKDVPFPPPPPPVPAPPVPPVPPPASGS